MLETKVYYDNDINDIFRDVQEFVDNLPLNSDGLITGEVVMCLQFKEKCPSSPIGRRQQT